jgi:hypothetical protein
VALKKNISILGVSLALLLSYVVQYSCSSSENPYDNPNNVSIDLILPDTIEHAPYTIDTSVFRIVTRLNSLIDSINLTIGDRDSVFTIVSDTIPVKFVFQDSGAIPITVRAYCQKGIVKECEKNLRVDKNPLAPIPISKWDTMIWDEDTWE